ncbi:amylo-alpha-1,6-glucosidase [Calidifontibacter sp. DB0510]|uniref:Amylo-alpha-1,6-glucosidase n=1 Tax=Metallococcus carri TaxID=1656884 RepID=A0A967B6E2_9MICO|nr:glycogen debranching N-terminal domain-containing protein [Metallococcus carri]NHN55526.1 amylo-alpha-1,6-glucosidase [Metallococcus carri]NOP38290.1 amylo-alpha-1,6-glucosidase [Calidifontibacter sp. DB2511S]
MTDPQQPWLHHLAIAVDGPLTTLSADDGTIAEGAHGVYLDDVRILDRLVIDIDGGVSQVATASQGNVSEFFGSARGLGDRGADPSVEVHRRRELTAPTLTETVTVRSRAALPVTATLRFELAADGADIAAVKHGEPAGLPVPMTIEGGTVRWTTGRLANIASWSVSPSHLARDDRGTVVAQFPIDLAPGTETQVALQITGERTRPSKLDADAGAARLALECTVSADDPRVPLAVQAALSDVAHLALTDPLAPEDCFLGAGTPWYLTLFGRDSIWAARMLLPLGTDLALGTLRTLARRQGTRVDLATAEQPGKIPHEVRRDAGPAGSLPTVYYGTVDATALWVCLLDDALAWGLRADDARELLPALRAALRWLTAYAAPDGDGLIKYIDDSGTGLVNQGWKDSGDSIRFRDGTIAEAPIALLEAQAYAVLADRAGARILRSLGTDADAELIDAAESQADALTAAVRERFWVSDVDRSWPAIAIDGQGEPVTGVASNMGHALGTGSYTADEARRVADVLMDPTMLSPSGIRTFASDNGGFNPIGYHTGSVWIHDTGICALGLAAEGLHDEVAAVTRSMLEATAYFGYRSPELHGDGGVLGRPVPYPASCRPQAWSAAATIAMLTAALGLRCDARSKVLTLRPGVGPFGALTLSGVRVAGQPVTIRVERDGSASVDGLPDGWRIERA